VLHDDFKLQNAAHRLSPTGFKIAVNKMFTEIRSVEAAVDMKHKTLRDGM
jgi:hypothetical protein